MRKKWMFETRWTSGTRDPLIHSKQDWSKNRFKSKDSLNRARNKDYFLHARNKDYMFLMREIKILDIPFKNPFWQFMFLLGNLCWSKADGIVF
jgi:hypothetical protein